MCVCALAYPWIRQCGGENTRFGVTTNYREIEGVIDHLCLMDFILLRHIKNGLELEMGSRVRLCTGKVLGIPRHPLKNSYLPSSVPLCLLSMDVGLN